MKVKMKVLDMRYCAQCKRRFRPARSKQKFCTAACRTAAYRDRRYERGLAVRMDKVVSQLNLGRLRDSMGAK